MAKLFSAACERNRDPILEVLREVFPREGLALEIAAGTGMHAVHFAPAFPGLTWQPTDLDDEALASIEAWRRDAGSPNLQPPIRLDVTDAAWPVGRADAVFNANMIHISPFECTRGLLEGVGRILADGGPLVMYGPYVVDGVTTAPSNEAFDASLRARDPTWGLRRLEEVRAIAAEAGLDYERHVAMPANNLCVIYRRRARP